MKIAYRTWERYNAVLKALGQDRRTAFEIAAAINMARSSIGNIMSAMTHKHYIEKHVGPGRKVVYTALIPELGIESVSGSSLPYADVVPEEVAPPHSRVIRFDTPNMQKKLVEQDRQTRFERKTRPVYISSSWNNI